VISFSFNTIAGLLVVLIGAGAIFLLAVFDRRHSPRPLRPIPGFQSLRRSIGLAVEDGKRLHVSIGNANILSPNSASALVGLSTLNRIAQLSMISDRPPIATSGEGSLAILSQDTLRGAYRSGNALDQYDPERARLAGPTPMSYIAGVIPIIHDEDISANLLVGSYGGEVALLTDAIDQENAFSLAASDSLTAQAALYATASEPLIGEELFAIPAYLQAGPFFTASLGAQDILRWIVIAAILVGSALKLLGIV
jgi:hypothetical protein